MSDFVQDPRISTSSNKKTYLYKRIFQDRPIIDWIFESWTDNKMTIAGIEDNLENCEKLFDLIIASEVLEHIENDEEEVKRLSKLLKPNGFFLATVPAYQFLFSIKDVKLHHKRRYNLLNFNKLTFPFFYNI